MDVVRNHCGVCGSKSASWRCNECSEPFCSNLPCLEQFYTHSCKINAGVYSISSNGSETEVEERGEVEEAAEDVPAEETPTPAPTEKEEVVVEEQFSKEEMISFAQRLLKIAKPDPNLAATLERMKPPKIKQRIEKSIIELDIYDVESAVKLLLEAHSTHLQDQKFKIFCTQLSFRIRPPFIFIAQPVNWNRKQFKLEIHSLITFLRFRFYFLHTSLYHLDELFLIDAKSGTPVMHSNTGIGLGMFCAALVANDVEMLDLLYPFVRSFRETQLHFSIVDFSLAAGSPYIFRKMREEGKKSDERRYSYFSRIAPLQHPPMFYGGGPTTNFLRSVIRTMFEKAHIKRLSRRRRAAIRVARGEPVVEEERLALNRELKEQKKLIEYYYRVKARQIHGRALDEEYYITLRYGPEELEKQREEELRQGIEEVNYQMKTEELLKELREENVDLFPPDDEITNADATTALQFKLFLFFHDQQNRKNFSIYGEFEYYQPYIASIYTVFIAKWSGLLKRFVVSQQFYTILNTIMQDFRKSIIPLRATAFWPRIPKIANSMLANYNSMMEEIFPRILPAEKKAITTVEEGERELTSEEREELENREHEEQLRKQEADRVARIRERRAQERADKQARKEIREAQKRRAEEEEVTKRQRVTESTLP